jgi:outer membrane protein OmpA-like peptidoglycan-associated protein
MAVNHRLRVADNLEVAMQFKPRFPFSVMMMAVLGSMSGARSESAPAPAAPSAADPLTALEQTSAEPADADIIAPTNTMQGTRGLSQTSSAVALGEGRLVFGLNGPWYRQQLSFAGTPNRDADIFTAVGTIGYGIAPQWDIFASVTGYGSNNYDSDVGSGFGTFGGGIQGTLPFSESAPIRMAAQLSAYDGLSDNPINQNYTDGYNYFETRTSLDFRGLLIQTFVVGKEASAFKWHFNEGMVTSASVDNPLLVLATGLQANVGFAALGLEAHSRTAFKNIDVAHDPFWITPSAQFRTGYNLNLSLGADVSISQERKNEPAKRALEPYRLFAGMDFTFDTRAEMRRQERMDALHARQERARLNEQNAELARKAVADSLALVAQREALAAKSREMASAMADARARIAAERSRRSESENQLLNTGMLVMDAVYFESGKTDISINSKPYLNMLAKMLAKYPKLRIEVGGHTDNKGKDAFNQGLSQGRAGSVMAFLLSQESSLAGRLTARGYGESQPKADNATAQGRLLNRRTELQVLNKDVLREYNETPQAAAPLGETKREAMGPEPTAP